MMKLSRIAVYRSFSEYRGAADYPASGLQKIAEAVGETFLGVVDYYVDDTGEDVRRGHVVLNEYQSGIEL